MNFAEYGGTQGAFDNSIWRQRILSNEDYFLSLESYTAEAIDDSHEAADDEAIYNNNNDNHNIDMYAKNRIIADEVSDDEFCDAADDNKSLDVEIDGNSIHFIDTETEDSEYDSDEKRVLSPRRKAPPIESLHEMFMKHEFSTFTLKESELDDLKSPMQ